MKNVIFLFALLVLCTNGYSQKKKPAAKIPTTVIAKANTLSAELSKTSFYLFATNKGKKDTIFVKGVDPKFTPAECKITPFTTKGTPLYLITWTEKNTTKTALKTEDAVSIISEIWEITPEAKSQILANKQTTTKIIEKVYLGKTDASETQERMRREGFEFTLTKEGDVILKNKTQESKMTYNATTKKYVADPMPKKKK
ncbi:hypothetical protein [Flavobacterium sp. GT3R68]|uniref:hypothetical protein n=1 Tax=Flavobacterium sp. GT3R68 TaxID=2594437 RepID=UPI000F86A41F|nr:hypothetical protein [Flavobacterium sp. GT3R68]RTY94945.1 hypothetical protein EKL32_08475 [Flavobacterium sp. GSN2]TRW91749.1 hypothetical protein FNW07_07650 [Flavobacterium sp. GT3R68]